MTDSTYIPITTGPDGSPVFSPEGGPDAHARREVVAAFRNARRYGGESCSGMGIRPAALALRMARERLAARDVAREALAEAEAARKEADKEGKARRYDPATLRADKARKVARRAERLCAWYGGGNYGPGTWQGGESAPDHAAKVAPRYGWRLASAMHGGERGGLFALHDGAAAWGVLRNLADVGDVCPRLPAGYYDNPFGESFRDGSGLCVGVVAQLRGRDGRAAYVAGYRFGGHDDSGTFDLRDVFHADASDESAAEEAREEAARRADGLAESAAEREREYQTAWQAGAAWADKGERLAEIRASLRAALRENRLNAASPEEMPATHAIFLEAIRERLAERSELIRERAELAEGDSDPFYFWPGESRLAEAFCEGASLDKMPGASA